MDKLTIMKLPNTTFILYASLALLLVVGGCGPADFGKLSNNADSSSSGSTFGNSTLMLEDSKWGRLVDVFDSEGELYELDVVVREDVISDGVDYSFSLNPLSQKEVLTILHPNNQPGSTAFIDALENARNGLATLRELGMDSAGPFVKVPRNAAVRLEFSEHVAPETVNKQTVRLLVGSEEEGFTNIEVKHVIKDEYDEGLNPVGVIILDPTISLLDAENSTSGLTVNGVGLPKSLDSVSPNVKVYIPSVVNVFANQTMVLENKARTQTFGLHTNEAGDVIIEPFELIGLDPVAIRAFRSGNDNDDYNGFLEDLIAPALISEQAVTISSIVSLNASRRVLTYSNNAVNCRGIAPKVGDVFELDGNLAGSTAFIQVTSIVKADDPLAYEVNGTVISGNIDSSSSDLQAVITTAYSQEDFDYQLCFVTFTPAPQELPATGVDPLSTITVMFSEAMNVSTIRSLDSMVLATANLNPDLGDGIPDLDIEWDSSNESVADYIDRLPGFASSGDSGRIMFGSIQPSGDTRSFTLSPLAGITDGFNEGIDAQISIALRNGNSGILDLAGNPVGFTNFVAGHSSQAATTPPLTLGPGAANIKYFALRGNGYDENNDQAPEYGGGQLGAYLGDGVLRGRTIDRFSRQADKTNTYVGQRIAFTSGIATPLVPAGAVLQSIYGYHHLGFGLSNPLEYNLDVEGLSWSPFQGIVFDTTFGRYSVALAHSRRQPDDYIDPGDGYPAHKNSGLRRLSGNLFDENIYAFGQDPVAYADLDEEIVFDVSQYSISQANVFTANGGVSMYPWPEFTDTFTYRDTSFPVPVNGYPQGGNENVADPGWGCPPQVVDNSLVFDEANIPTIGLPLLMRFRCYPTGAEYGYNGSQVQIMVGSSSLPAFRVFSWGGLTGSVWEFVVPDLDGAGTSPTQRGSVKAFGPELYWGQVDFVTKVSRVFTHWFNAGGPVTGIYGVVLEPTPLQAEPGTSVEVQFRASSNVDVSGCINETTPLQDATNSFDAYGNYDGCGIVDNPPTEWVSDPAGLAVTGYQYFQLRFTFIANTDLNLEAEMDAFGFAYTTN